MDLGRSGRKAVDSSGAHGRVLALLALLSSLAVLNAATTSATGSGNVITVVDNVGNALRYPSIALDESGYPVMAYYDFSSAQLKVMHCGDANCSSGNTVVVPDANALDSVSLALDTDDNPVIASTGSGGVEVVHCGDPLCTSGNTIATIDPQGANAVSMALDSDGRPVVSYYAYTDLGQELRIAHCGDTTCAVGNIISSAGSVKPIGHTPIWMVLDANGYPVVSVFDAFAIKILHCGDETCTSGNSIASPDVGGYGLKINGPIGLDDTGNPIVIAVDLSNPSVLKLLHCGSPTCATGNTVIPLDDGVGLFASMKLDSAGNPVIGYHGTRQNLKLIHCGDPDCTSGNSMTSPDRAGAVGYSVSLVLDVAGDPVIVYENWDTGDLKVLRCGDPDCHEDGDSDGCVDAEEILTSAGDQTFGGWRNPKNPYDFYDTDGNKLIDLFNDIFNVAFAFGDDADSDPPGEPDGYDATYDRSAPLPGDDVWDMHAPDGLIDLFIDIFGVAFQFGHDCS